MQSPVRNRALTLGIALIGLSGSIEAQAPASTVQIDSVSVHFVDADLRAVIQALAGYLPKPVLSNGVPAVKVTLETPTPVPRAQILSLLTGLADGQGLRVSEEPTFYRVGPKPADPAPVPAPTAAAAAGPMQLYAIRLKHARAGDVAATVNLLFGGGGAFAGSSGLSTGTLSQELRRQQVPPAAPPGSPAGQPAPSVNGAAFSGQVTIVPDELTNSLLVRAAPADYAVLTQAIDQLDIRPLQVLIEVLIVEARHDLTRTFGTDLTLHPRPLDGGTIDAHNQGAGLTDLVVKLMSIGHGKIDAILSAAQTKGDVDIISRPVLIASNNTEAHFLVGTQQPFVQVSRSLPTDNNNRDQVVQYQDVGTKLTVKPTINQDGYVSLIIQQEVNNATGDVAFDAPIISTREASTQVLVKDRQTIVIGGLRDLQVTRSSAGIPILSSLPLIGGIFGSTKREKHNTELFIFLTPRILTDDSDVDSVTAPRLTVPGAE